MKTKVIEIRKTVWDMLWHVVYEGLDGKNRYFRTTEEKAKEMIDNQTK